MLKMSKKIIALIALLVMLPAVLLGCGREEEQKAEETIKIGCVLSMSGALGAMGVKMADAVKMAVDEINAQGGINGKKIELLLEDDATDPVQSLSAVRKLHSVDGVNLMIAGMTSGAAKAIGPHLAENKILAISPSATSPLLTGKPWRDYFFRTVPSDAFQGRAMAELAANKNLNRIVIFVMNNPYGMGLGKAAQEALKEKGIEVLDFIKYDPAKLDYLTELTHIKALNPDGVIHVGYNDDGRIVYKQALDLGLDNITWIGSDGVYGTGMLETEPSKEFMLRAVIGTRPAPPEGVKEYEEFKAAFREKYGTEPEVFCDTAYDAMKLLALAIERAGSTDTEAVSAALREIRDYPGASGTISFDEGGDRVGAIYEVWDVVEKDGEVKFVRVDTIELK
ncbi:ABC transporter substrate-binding protein [Peptococcaceae bacterium]|nr:ABC transporter substrate-binding protein [Peptococcaceae bacterium]